MKKNLISFIVIFASLSSLVMITNAAQRRFGMQTASKILNTPVSKTTPIFGHTSRSSSLPCLQTSKRAFATESQKFARKKYPKKLFFTSIAGAACTAGTISDDTQHEPKKEDLHEELFYLLENYNKNPLDLEHLNTLITKLQENGKISEMKEGHTPLSIVLAADLQLRDKKMILKELLSHGANPGERELFIMMFSLNASVIKNSLQKKSQIEYYLIPELDLTIMSNPTITYSDIRSDLRPLKVLLPYYDQNTLKTLETSIQQIIDKKNKDFLDYKLKINDELRANYDREVAVYNAAIMSREFDLLSKEQQNNVKNYYSSSLHNKISDYHHHQRLHEEKEKKLETQLMPLKRILHITQKALNKGKLSGTSAYKEIV